MTIPAIRGIIDRRILVNYRIDADALAAVLPPPFQPKLVSGFGMGGICLIRLKHIRPRFVKPQVGIESENAAHRIAVEWTEDGIRREGVYIPRRDTSSWLNALAGGRIFPGTHNRATFNVKEDAEHYSISLRSDDGRTSLRVDGRITDHIPGSSMFRSIAEASEFFERGSLGYSATAEPNRFEGLELRCLNWHVEPLAVEEVASSFFDDRDRFPSGTTEFDCALLMRAIEHEWHGHATLCVGIEEAAS